MKTCKMGCGKMKSGGAATKPIKKMKSGGSAKLKGIINKNFPMSGTTGPISMKNGGFKKSLVKADNGIISKQTSTYGPKTIEETNMNDPMAYERGPRVTTPRQDADSYKPSLRQRIKNKTRKIGNEYRSVNQDKSKFEKILGPIIGAATLGAIGSKILKKEKKGGSVKTKKFAALAPPYDKATAADRIAGAKKNARKKR